MPVFDATTLRPLKNGWDTFSEAVSGTFRDGVDSFLMKYTGADLFIVTGRGGVGKSSIIKCITGEDVYVGSTLESATRTTSLSPAVINGKRCLFLDMPGFNTVDFDDWDIFHRLMTAMSVVQRYVRFRGVLYVDPIEDSRWTPEGHKILTWLLQFCGESFMPNVTIVTTKWAGLDEYGIETKMARVERWKEGELLRPFFQHGAQVYHHGLVQDGEQYRTLHVEHQFNRRQTLARNLIASRYGDPSPLELKVYTEIAAGATIDTTSAARSLKKEDPVDSTAHGSNASGDGPSQSNPTSGDHEGNAQQTPSGTPLPGGSSLTFEDIKPWVKLLGKAALTYAKAASGSTIYSAESPLFYTDDEDGMGFVLNFSGDSDSSTCTIL